MKARLRVVVEAVEVAVEVLFELEILSAVAKASSVSSTSQCTLQRLISLGWAG